jgi:transcriptional regulator with XRE-family HTH domain
VKRTYLRTARERKGLTQEQLAAAVGLTQASISQLETREGTRPAFDTVVALAAALGVDPMALRFGPDPKRQVREAVTR